MSGDDDLAARVMVDYRTADLTPRERAIADFADKLTRTPQAMGPADLERLREHGLGDRAILDASHVIGYFNHINRVADALGIDLEDDMPARPSPGGQAL